MTARLAPVAIRLFGVVAVLVGGYFALSDPARSAEARASVWVLQLLGSNRVHLLSDSSILVVDSSRSFFRVVVTPSCSALPAALAILCLGVLTARNRSGRRLRALVAAESVVVLGNLLRISASVAIGLAAGRGSLVLFHDWVGNIFTFAYVLGGYMIMLYLLLPDRRQLVTSAHV